MTEKLVAARYGRSGAAPIAPLTSGRLATVLDTLGRCNALTIFGTNFTVYHANNVIGGVRKVVNYHLCHVVVRKAGGSGIAVQVPQIEANLDCGW